MSSITVTTKDELKKAYDTKPDEIIVEGKLAKDLKKCENLGKAAPGVLAAVGASVAVITAGIAAAPATFGISAVASLTATTTAASITGLEVAGVIIACSIGFTIVWGVTHDYNFIYETDGNGSMKIRMEKK